MSATRLPTRVQEVPTPFKDSQVSYSELKRVTRIDASSLVGIPYTISPNGQRTAWVSDIGIAANIEPSSISHALRVAHLDRLERGY